MIRPPPKSPLFPYPTLSRSPSGAPPHSNPNRNGGGGRDRGDDPDDPPLTRGEAEEPARLERLVPVRHELEPSRFLGRSEEHTSELQSLAYLVCRLLLEKKKK